MKNVDTVYPTMFSFAPQNFIDCFPSSFCFHIIYYTALDIALHNQIQSDVFLLLSQSQNTLSNKTISTFCVFCFGGWIKLKKKQINGRTIENHFLPQQLSECMKVPMVYGHSFLPFFFFALIWRPSVLSDVTVCIKCESFFRFELSMFNHRSVSCAYSVPLSFSAVLSSTQSYTV